MNAKQRMRHIKHLADEAEKAMKPKPPSKGYPNGRPAVNVVSIPGGGCLGKFTKTELDYLLTRFKSVRGPMIFLGYVEFERK